MKVTTLREALEHLEVQGRGDCSLYAFPARKLLEVSHRPGLGVVVGFDDDDYPVEAINDTFTRPEDAAVIFLEFGIPDENTRRPKTAADA